MPSVEFLIEQPKGKRIAKRQRYVAYDFVRDETLINVFIVSTIDVVMSSKYIVIGKRYYIPIKDLIVHYSGEMKNHFVDLDKKIRKWALDEKNDENP